jgi:hypothetical protein
MLFEAELGVGGGERLLQRGLVQGRVGASPLGGTKKYRVGVEGRSCFQ